MLPVTFNDVNVPTLVIFGCALDITVPAVVALPVKLPVNMFAVTLPAVTLPATLNVVNVPTLVIFG